MGLASGAVKVWMDAHEQRMISCPYQPGRLVISKEACLKRHSMALQERYEDLEQVDFFRQRLKNGLALCSKCEIGERLARSTPNHAERGSASAAAA
jgi:hypothetical protein